MLSTIRKSAATVAALGALALGGSAIAGAADDQLAGTASSGRRLVADGAPATRGALQRASPPRSRPPRWRRCPARPCCAPRPADPTARPTTPTSGRPTARPRSCSWTPRSRPRRFSPTGAAAASGTAHGGPGAHGPETPLTGDTKDKVEAAVLAEYSGATIVRTETNGDSSAPYESHIKTSAGKELEVLVSKDFKVLDAREHPARPLVAGAGARRVAAGPGRCCEDGRAQEVAASRAWWRHGAAVRALLCGELTGRQPVLIVRGHVLVAHRRSAAGDVVQSAGQPIDVRFGGSEPEARSYRAGQRRRRPGPQLGAEAGEPRGPGFRAGG